METILCAAIWYKDYPCKYPCVTNVDTLVLFGHRHHNVIALCTSLLSKRQCEMGAYEQGFITSLNRFVSREEAAVIATRAQQLKKGIVSVQKLFSEDLY